MMQVLSQRRELLFGLLHTVFLTLNSLRLAKGLQLFLELFVLALESLEFLLAQVEVVDVLADEETSEYFLDDDGLLGEVGEVLLVVVLHLLGLEHLAGVEDSEDSLYFDGCGFLLEELLALGVHAELGLDLQAGLVIAIPVLLGFVGGVVVQLGQGVPEVLFFLD